MTQNKKYLIYIFTMPKFIPGLKLSELFFKEAVKPLIKSGFPGLEYSAGLIDHGSEVLGFDTELSTDHHWGPRVLLFISPKDIGLKKQIFDFLGRNLPPSFRGYSTHFGDPDQAGVRLLAAAKAGQPISHRVEIHTIGSFFKNYLLIEPKNALTASGWLTLSEQKLRTIRSGKIFHDQLGLKQIQNKLHYFPRDIWLYMLSSEWTKISQEEPFVGRCGDVNDEMGSRILAARLVQSIMKLCFLMEKEYAPYSKWYGTAFSRLKCAKKLSPVLHKVLASEYWKEREKHLSLAYKIVAQMHNSLKLTRPMAADVSRFYNRPYLVIRAGIFASELKKRIKDPVVKRIPADIGSVNQFTNTVDLLENNELLKRMNILYR
ncbi:TPA: hypothetical protein DCG35_03925 [Candidatus Edwardsbacteria bacterium]|nr:hypothetical protein [Candidatus Edwardsbacteria bacterium]